jgi:hypothetical protein
VEERQSTFLTADGGRRIAIGRGKQMQPTGRQD